MPEAKIKCAKCGVEMLAATAKRTGGMCMPCHEGRPRPVSLTHEEAERELERAAGALETRAQLLRVRTSKIAQTDWNTLAPFLRDVVPTWYRQLLTRFSLYGVGLEYRDAKQSYVRLFSFAGPDDYNSTMEEESDYAPLLSAGFLPIGYESDGSLWVIPAPFVASSPVYLLDHSDWDGGVPTRRNGLTFAASRLSLLLCSMAISELSYQDSPNGVTSILWCEDQAVP